jgi:hypothetical protein
MRFLGKKREKKNGKAKTAAIIGRSSFRLRSHPFAEQRMSAFPRISGDPRHWTQMPRQQQIPFGDDNKKSKSNNNGKSKYKGKSKCGVLSPTSLRVRTTMVWGRRGN